MRNINENIKNNLLSKKTLPFVLVMFLVEFLNIKFEVITSNIVNNLNLVILILLSVMVINYFWFLYQGYTRKKIFMLYGHSSYFILIVFLIILVGFFVILIRKEESIFVINENFSVVLLLINLMILTLERLGMIELLSDSIFIKDDKNIFRIKNSEILSIQSNGKLTIESVEQEVIISKNIIIEREKGELENLLRNKIVNA